jgi:hypothetical protein
MMVAKLSRSSFSPNKLSNQPLNGTQRGTGFYNHGKPQMASNYQLMHGN